MILKIYTVRDRQTVQYGTPMFLVSHGQAIRSFSDEVNRASEDNQLYKHANDFDLFYVGEYDTESAVFTTHEPEQIAIGANLQQGSPVRSEGQGPGQSSR